VRAKKCPECLEKYQPTRQLQPCCEKMECKAAVGIRHAEATRKRRQMQERNVQAADRKVFRLKLEKIKTIPQLTHEAQTAVNRYRRIEELMKGSGCISCGRTQAEVQATDGWKHGGAWDAGHFVSVGSMPAKRFNPLNIWLQCKSCNAGSGKYTRKQATVSKSYEANLIALIGLDAVEELKRDAGPAKFGKDELRAIKAEYVAKLKSLKAENQ